MKEGFEKCYCEHTLFVKKDNENILIVSLYVDDLIYTGNSIKMFERFKKSIIDLGRMKYFLGVGVIQDEK